MNISLCHTVESFALFVCQGTQLSWRDYIMTHYYIIQMWKKRNKKLLNCSNCRGRKNKERSNDM